MAQEARQPSQVDKIGRGVTRKIGAAIGTLAGAPIPLLGQKALAAVGGFVGDKLWPAIKYAPAAIFSTVIATSIQAVVGTIIAVIILIFTAGFVMLVINSGAYIVPPGGLEGAPGEEIGQVQGCFELDGSWASNLQGAANVASATGQMVEQPAYIQKLCGNNRIIVLSYCPASVAFGGYTVSADQICFGSLGVSNPGAAFYTLAHESGHILNNRTSYISLYIDGVDFSELPSSGPKQGQVCTYPIPVNPPPEGTNGIYTQKDIDTFRNYFWVWSTAINGWIKVQGLINTENFAEMIALYYVGGATSSTRSLQDCPDGFNMQTFYPSHYNFADQVLFN